MRTVTKADARTIYRNTAPHIIGEGALIGGIGMMIYGLVSFDPKGLLGVIFLAIGFHFVRNKYLTMKQGVYVLENGIISKAKITNINGTSTEHNGRTVLEYTFKYEVEGKPLSYKFRSAYSRHLKEGYELKIYYVKSNPKLAFIPSLYNLYI